MSVRGARGIVTRYGWQQAFFFLTNREFRDLVRSTATFILAALVDEKFTDWYVIKSSELVLSMVCLATSKGKGSNGAQPYECKGLVY